MKKKDIEKLINSQNVENKFEKINKKIDYSKYEKVPVKPRVFEIKARHVFASILALLILSATVNSVYCNAYNNYIDKKINELLLEGVKLKKINNQAEYKEALTNDSLSLYNSKKVSWFDSLNRYLEHPKNDSITSGTIEQEKEYDVTDTNNQVRGIDEADVSKCDGKYIYAAYDDCVMIFDLNGNVVDREEYPSKLKDKMWRPQMYVEDENVIITSSQFASFYDFVDGDLLHVNTIEYKNYLDSRLYDNNLYLVAKNAIDSEMPEDENVYYTVGSRVKQKYDLYKINLDSNEIKKTSNLNAGNVVLYMSNEHIYLATLVHYVGESGFYSITVTSIFDKELQPVGAIGLDGNVLNQFSMDEYNGYFRVVTSDLSKANCEINALSIYSLETLQKVGSINKNLGEDKQTVRSVAFDKDTCHVVTYEVTDPLYEIDLSDVTNPKIVSIYKAPGYSSYLQKFEIEDKEYLFGLGYTDDSYIRKISIYEEEDDGTSQVGEDFLMSSVYINNKDIDIFLDYANYDSFSHKALFVYNDGNYLYLGMKLETNKYYIFKIDVDSNEVVSIYKTFEFKNSFNDSRCYMINGKLYITDYHRVVIKDFK